MIANRLIPLAALALLAGCDVTPTGQPTAPPKAPEPSAFQKSVIALSDAERNVMFIRAIRDANLECQGVTASERRGEALNGDPLYIAHCGTQQTYGVAIGREGTARVMVRTGR